MIKNKKILEIENNIMGVVNICYPKNKKYYVFFKKNLTKLYGWAHISTTSKWTVSLSIAFGI